MIEPSTDTELSLQIERSVALLVSNGFRVTRPLMPRNTYREDLPESNELCRGVVVDTETTGIDFHSEYLLEIGLVAFEYDPRTGAVYRVLDSYNGFEDPGVEVPSDATRVHGLSAELLQGQTFDDARVEDLVRGATIVIAHNAAFDRPFVEDRFPIFERLLWACSMKQIPWYDLGFEGTKLEYLAYRAGFHYAGHRALNDCQALLELIASPLPCVGGTGLGQLLKRYREPTAKVRLPLQSLQQRRRAKSLGATWDPSTRCWFVRHARAGLEDFLAQIAGTIYGDQPPGSISVEVVDATSRYSLRSGDTQLLQVPSR